VKTKAGFDNFSQKQLFFLFLQLLSFIRNFKPSEYFVKKQVYYGIDFPFRNFLQFIGIPGNNNYQRTKTLHLLLSFQEKNGLIQKFSEKNFRSAIMFPYFEIEKSGRE
jgi:hypothetical protein